MGLEFLVKREVLTLPTCVTQACGAGSAKRGAFHGQLHLGESPCSVTISELLQYTGGS